MAEDVVYGQYQQALHMQHLKFGAEERLETALVVVNKVIHLPVEVMDKKRQKYQAVSNIQFVRQGRLAVDKKETVNKVMIHMYVDQVTGVQERVEEEFYVQNVLCITTVIHVVE
jgi:hypothetical protein